METGNARAAARLRRAFRYSSDEDDGTDLSPEEMDEEEQEHLLTNLQASESASNRQYTLVLTGLPLIVIFPFLRYLTLSTTASMATLCLLSITSLMASAYIMYFVPITDIDAGFSSNSKPNVGGGASGPSQRSPSSIFAPTSGGPITQRRRLPTLLLSDSAGSPITRYLPLLNAAISALLFLAAMVYRSNSSSNSNSNAKTRPDVPEGLWLFLLLPPVIFAMVYMAKRSMGEIQTGLSQLQALRYDYKGA
ncbi:hypothetical protein A1O1_08105 [Capronia coronata CBS 617.96]|uniref:Uncharacterized protein n=1 Tax=Capronia coronata CBS 617.96 TaxID=1182541 RepID=W9XNB9_9EURO|nr:uncharacterized protein A1O1_08105 [Capronia coronata CBS 617.96]EXJ82037.1 hypothetical protein A1O1_08105 [Capronia coronata CBS 617.96]